MEWYEIVILILIIPAGAYVRGKIYEHNKNNHSNDSWKNRKR
jgi:hypothetical protein